MDVTISLVPSPLTNPILDGSIAVEGVRLRSSAAKNVDQNSRRMLDGAFDIAEMSFATFLCAVEAGAPLVGLPVFPGRRFVQPGIACRAGGRVRSPADLAGRRVAVPQYWLTSSIWHRGILAQEYGVAPASVEWVTAVPERGGAGFPPGIGVTHQPDVTIAELLETGTVDAALLPRPIAAAATPGIACLFADPVAAQLDYFKRTGIFPLMHFIVAQRPVLAAAPELAAGLVTAFEAAKSLGLAAPESFAAHERPVFGLSVADGRAWFGGDPWPSGIESNRDAIETFFDFAHDQGLVRVRPVPDRLFVGL